MSPSEIIAQPADVSQKVMGSNLIADQKFVATEYKILTIEFQKADILSFIF